MGTFQLGLDQQLLTELREMRLLLEKLVGQFPVTAVPSRPVAPQDGIATISNLRGAALGEGMRVTTAVYLRTRGYYVVEVATGKAALQEALRTSFRVILMDLHLEDMSGLECLGRLRRQRAGRGPAVVILTADIFAMDDLREDAHGFNATIHSKLSDPETLDELIDQLIAPVT